MTQQKKCLGRAFCSGKNVCENGCKYCFASWRNAPKFSRTVNILSNMGQESIIYPICDSELLQQGEECWDFLSHVMSMPTIKMLCISTKNEWSDAAISKLIRMSTLHNNCIIKLNISLTCRNNVLDIEPYAASYESRIDLFRRLSKKKIMVGVMLKPLLPFIQAEEYVQIIEEVIPYCNRFVIGDLYVDCATDFYNEYIRDTFLVEKRYCSWMNREVDFVVHPQRQYIKDFICKVGGLVYESDLEQCMSLLNDK